MWAALTLGIFGLVIFAQDPAGGLPFLLAAAYFGWHARARLGSAASAGIRSTRDSVTRSHKALGTTLTRIDFSAAFIVRIALALAAACLLIVAIGFGLVAIDEFPLLQPDRVYAVRGAAVSLVTGYGVVCLMRFRATLKPQGLPGQLRDGALRFAAGSFGFFLAIMTAHMTEQAVNDNNSLARLAGLMLAVLALPALCLAAGGAIAFAHRTQLAARRGSRPVLRAALFAQAGAGILGMLLIIGVAALKSALFTDPFALADFLMPGVACGLIAIGAVASARAATADFRSAALSYGAVLLMLLSVRVLIMWAGAFALGGRLFETWNVLVVFAPFVVLLTTALSLLGLVFGAKLYGKALSQ